MRKFLINSNNDNKQLIIYYIMGDCLLNYI